MNEISLRSYFTIKKKFAVGLSFVGTIELNGIKYARKRLSYVPGVDWIINP